MAEMIRTSGQSLERLLSDMLDLARVEAGELDARARAVRPGRLLRAVAALFADRAPEKGLALATRDRAAALDARGARRPGAAAPDPDQPGQQRA